MHIKDLDTEILYKNYKSIKFDEIGFFTSIARYLFLIYKNGMQ